jgi:hypothetical protein
VERELFERVYDRTILQLFRAKESKGWRVIDLAQNRDRIVRPDRKSETVPFRRTISVCHDVERGYGHTDVDPVFAQLAHETGPRNLEEMLKIEAESDVTATYNVLGKMLEEVRASIESGGHCLGFHSYDHEIASNGNSLARIWRQLRRSRPGVEGQSQLERCREVDYRLKGYRPPQSRMTPELSDAKLAFHNFEWLASSSYSLGIGEPQLRNGLVRIPISFDDFDMYERQMKFEDWQAMAFATIQANDFVAFSLHDCYAHFWLPHYRSFLAKLKTMGRLQTLDEVAAEVVFINAA